jgi:hypothetical protein
MSGAAIKKRKARRLSARKMTADSPSDEPSKKLLYGQLRRDIIFGAKRHEEPIAEQFSLFSTELSCGDSPFFSGSTAQSYSKPRVGTKNTTPHDEFFRLFGSDQTV